MGAKVLNGSFWRGPQYPLIGRAADPTQLGAAIGADVTRCGLGSPAGAVGLSTAAQRERAIDVRKSFYVRRRRTVAGGLDGVVFAEVATTLDANVPGAAADAMVPASAMLRAGARAHAVSVGHQARLYMFRFGHGLETAYEPFSFSASMSASVIASTQDCLTRQHNQGRAPGGAEGAKLPRPRPRQA